jgi:hypothetical protein
MIEHHEKLAWSKGSFQVYAEDQYMLTEELHETHREQISWAERHEKLGEWMCEQEEQFCKPLNQ